MRLPHTFLALLATSLVLPSLGLAPAAPEYYGVEREIARIQQSWQAPGARPQPNAPGWNALFDALRADFRAYAEAPTEADRLRALDRIYRVSRSLGAVAWGPAAQLREVLRDWLRPRVRLAWAEQRLEAAVRGLPTPADAATRANRDRWLRFVDDDLGRALREYEAATTVAARQDALHRVYAAINQLQRGNQARPWAPALELETALNDLFNRPNLDVTADLASVSPFLNNDIVESGPIAFKGHVSNVTAGPKTGFGLLPYDGGIAFYNSQISISVTPLYEFNQQVAQDRKGRRAAKLYHFDATTTDQSNVTVVAVITPDGLHLSPPQIQHGISAPVTSTPTQGHGLGRGIAALIGFNQPRITQQVYEGAVGQVQQGVVEGAAELGAIKTAEAEAQRNAQIRRFLPGDGTLAANNFLIRGLAMASQPDHVQVGGTVEWRGGAEQVGADQPQPPSFRTREGGVTVDVHLPSVATNLIRGRLQQPDIQKVTNLMIVTRKIPPGAPPRSGVVLSQNVDFATFSQAVETARAANDPKVLAVRVKRPGRAPEFAVDRDGNLVATIHDFAIEVPAPPQAARGGGLTGPPARIYMLTSPRAEVVIQWKITAATGNEPVKLQGRIVGFDPGPRPQVFAIMDDEKNPAPLTAFTSNIVMRVFGTRLQGQPIDLPLGNINLGNFVISKVSDPDPSGWTRLVLTPPVSGSRPPSRPLRGQETPLAPVAAR